MGEYNVDENLKDEIRKSTVVLLNEVWYSQERVGKISDEFNENIPDFIEKTGYVEINTPIDMQITLLSWDTKQYYVFYVSKGTPFVAKLPQCMYKVTDINTVGLGKYETSLPNSNIITLTDENEDRDKPYIIDVSMVVDKYAIPEGDISGKPDLSLDKNQHIPEEKTVVDADALKRAQELAKKSAEEQDFEKNANNDNSDKKSRVIISLLIVSGILAIWKSIEKIKEKNYAEEDVEKNDEYDNNGSK